MATHLHKETQLSNVHILCKWTAHYVLALHVTLVYKCNLISLLISIEPSYITFCLISEMTG
jgi:hypothetical protein